jgi:hypothetical protein
MAVIRSHSIAGSQGIISSLYVPYLLPYMCSCSIRFSDSDSIVAFCIYLWLPTVLDFQERYRVRRQVLCRSALNIQETYLHRSVSLRDTESCFKFMFVPRVVRSEATTTKLSRWRSNSTHALLSVARRSLHLDETL